MYISELETSLLLGFWSNIIIGGPSNKLIWSKSKEIQTKEIRLLSLKDFWKNTTLNNSFFIK